eukprot:1951276-Rhodomonas_salina.1
MDTLHAPTKHFPEREASHSHYQDAGDTEMMTDWTADGGMGGRQGMPATTSFPSPDMSLAELNNMMCNFSLSAQQQQQPCRYFRRPCSATPGPDIVHASSLLCDILCGLGADEARADQPEQLVQAWWAHYAAQVTPKSKAEKHLPLANCRITPQNELCGPDIPHGATYAAAISYVVSGTDLVDATTRSRAEP